MKKVILLFATLLFSWVVSAQTPLNNFDQLMNALKSGKSVKAVIYYGKTVQLSQIANL